MRTRPDHISTITLPSSTVRVDEAGYLVDPALWSREFAMMVAAQEDIGLTPLHWEIIEFMRDHNDVHGVMVDVRHVIKHLAKLQGMDKNPARRLLFEMFPYGYVKQAVKIAGMKQPRAWSTG